MCDVGHQAILSTLKRALLFWWHGLCTLTIMFSGNLFGSPGMGNLEPPELELRDRHELANIAVVENCCNGTVGTTGKDGLSDNA